MKTLLAIAAMCCVAVSSAFPLYGSRSVPIVKGGGHAFCPTHGRFHMGFDHGLHADRFQQLGLVGYYGDYQNLRQDGGLQGPSMGYFGNDNYNNDQGFDDFNGGFNNMNNGIIGNDEVALGIGPFRRRSFPSGPFGGDFGGDDFSNDDFSRGIGRDDFPRGPVSRVRSLGPVGGLPLAPIQQAQFPTRGGGIQGGIIPRNDFDNGGFINNDLSLIHDQINH